MEFVIGNIVFDGAKSLSDGLYYDCTKDLLLIDNFFIIYEGYIVDETQNVLHYCKCGLDKIYLPGAYNIFCYDSARNMLIFKNDKRATLPLYYYHKDGKFLCSNNVWRLVKILQEAISINMNSLKTQLCFFTDLNIEETLFTNIFRMKGARVLKFEGNQGNTCEWNEYWKFVYTPNEMLTLKEAIDDLDRSFKNYFSIIHKQNLNKILGFGNSGGLDSRLIAHYASLEKIPMEGYVIANHKPHLCLKSTTTFLSDKIANLYNFHSRIIEYSLHNVEKLFLLDIRNAPFMASQSFINYYDKINFFDYEIAGQPGGIVYLPDAVLKGNDKDILLHTEYFLGRRKGTLPKMKDDLRKMCSYLQIKYNLQNNNGFLGLSHSYLDSVLDYDPLFFRNRLTETIESIKGRNHVETWIRIHDGLTTKYQYRGGYDSINGICKSYFLYYPFFYDKIQYYPLSFFDKRNLLREFIRRINPALSNIPGQDMHLPGKENRFHSLCKTIEMAMRGRGLNFDYILSSVNYKRFVRDVLELNNSYFYSIIDRKKLIKSKLPYTYEGMSILKIKLLLDIFENKEWDKLENIDFVMCTW